MKKLLQVIIVENKESSNHEERDSLSESKESQLEEVEIVLDNPSQALNSIQNIQNKLVDNDPEQFLAFLEKYNNDQAEITKIREENRHKEIVAREANKKDLQTGIENTKRITIASVVAIVISGFVYAGFTKDSALTDKIITALLGVGTGAGGASLFIKKENKKPPEE